MDQLVGIIWDGVTRLFGCAKVHAAYVCELEKYEASLKGKWEQLENMYKDMKQRIDDAETTGDMRRTNEVNGWLQQVQNLQEVMGNILNSPETHNKCLSGCCPKNCMSSYKLGKKVFKMLNEVDELVTSGKNLKNVDITYKPPFNQVNEMPSIETVGLDLMLNKVWKSLEDGNTGIIGLYGMGGAGKTTLMKIINNEFGKRKHDFAVVLWVVVSRDCDINKIMNDIRNRLGVTDDIWNKSSQDEKVAKIYQVLKQKKFVLMIDDLWGKLELEKVGVPLPKESNNQSKVLFTTRSEDVCAKMQAQEKFKVECLSEEEAFDLFCKRIGEKTLKCHGEIPKLAREMANECKGLPLALITVGSAMAGVNNIEAWRQAKKDLRSSPWIASDLEEKVFHILKFSYDRLPDETHKICFLYCALYPEDYVVRVDRLIDRWIGEGILGSGYKSKNIYDMYEEGELRRLRRRLPIEFKNLKNLRVFLMENVLCDFEIIPLEVIESLEHLKVFRFHSLKGRAEEEALLESLERLKVFRFHPVGCSREEALLERLESLPELEELCVTLQTLTGMQKLVNSTTLRDCSRDVRLRGIEEPLEMTSLLASLSTMKQLGHLTLRSVPNIMEGSSITDTCHLRKLRWVEIELCSSLTHLTWLKYAPLVEFINVQQCELIEEVVKGAEDEDGKTDIENANDIFSNLRFLFLHTLPKLKSIHERVLAFPSLKYITILGCPNLRKLPLNSNSAKDLIKIKYDSDIWWNNLQWEDATIKDRLQTKLSRD